MRVIIQRVLKSSVLIDENEEKYINEGLMILLGMTYNDTIEDIKYLVNKILNLRIFEKNNKMGLSVKDINGEILLIPQFTLYADCRKGNRPSFTNALESSLANELFDIFKEELFKSNLKIQTGKFKSYMKVSLINDGPVTIIIDSKAR
ncbi:MAG: D-tyrosyl-tRNA(Tyr) deacylase [Bacilli bacterium]|nr:D-tyrosyl-tRNA(Tyr) deacylase [Bacilli bacterium]